MARCTKTRRPARRGMVIVYISMVIVIFMAFASLAVDVGKLQVVKTEMRKAADAAALYGVSGMATSITEAQNRAIDAANDNTAYGSPIVITTSDIEFGSWNPSARTFTVLTGTSRSSANAMRVTVRRTAARGTATPTTFAGVVGMRQVDITVTSIATRGQVISANVDADSCPWLAGASNGTRVEGYDGNDTDAIAPAQNPYQVTGLTMTAGQKLSFQKVSGQTSYEDAADYGPDGNTDWIVRQNPTNGINATKAPLNSLVGIFLNNSAPSGTMAAELDFTTPASRNFSTYSPLLKQVFFIGDGLKDDGTLQQFVVPSGATRLYLCIMDEKGWWWDNTGYLQTTVMDTKPALVK